MLPSDQFILSDGINHGQKPFFPLIIHYYSIQVLGKSAELAPDCRFHLMDAGKLYAYGMKQSYPFAMFMLWFSLFFLNLYFIDVDYKDIH